MMVVNHCHVTNKFLGWAYQDCNLARRTPNFTPVVAHNLSNYHMHAIVHALHNASMKNQFSVVPSTDEKYISRTMSLWIKEIQDKHGKKQIYENLRFIDSYKFMLSSLSQLIANLPSDGFQLMEKQFASMGYSQKQIDLLKQKGYYPFSYVNSFEKLEETKLPARRLWKNSLQGAQVSVDKLEYKHANKVIHQLRCKNVGDYHDIYLPSDVLLLACLFEQFRSVCHVMYKMDCFFHYTASNLAGDAFLKACRADLRLLTEGEHLDITQKLIRGGMSSVYAKKYWKANNKYTSSFDPNEGACVLVVRFSTPSFIINIDANNLYGGIMENYPLPIKYFVLIEKALPQILMTSPDSQLGYVVECALEIPEDLHGYFQNFLIAPTIVTMDMLSTDQNEMLARLNVKTLPKVPKLMQILNPKHKYVLHYLTVIHSLFKLA